jgi:DNA-binding transcriptional LysR family regulator
MGVQLTELTAFVAVAEQLSFTKAAVQVGVALPTMSQTIRSLEERLGVRLFNRTTRSVALTEAGDRLLLEIQPIIAGIDHALESVNLFRDNPVGTLRLAVARPAATRVLAPIIQPFLAEYPAIRLEVSVDDTNSDIVSGRFDAGIRVGHRVERDMTILRLLDEFRMLAVATPGYLARHPAPPQPKDLHFHNCIRYRQPWDGSFQPWVFRAKPVVGAQAPKGGAGRHPTEISVEGSLIANDMELVLSAALDGVGVAYLAEPLLATPLAEGRLVALLQGWCSTLPGVFLYYPSRRQIPMPLLVFLKFIETWRKAHRPVASREVKR